MKARWQSYALVIIYIQILFDVGIFGLLLYVLIFVTAFKEFKGTKVKDDLSYAGLVFVIVTMVYGINGWGMLKEPSTNMFWISLGLICNAKYKT